MRHNRRDDGQLSCRKREMKTMNANTADGVLVIIFVSHSSSLCYHLKRNTTTTMAKTLVSFDFVFHKLSGSKKALELKVQVLHGCLCVQVASVTSR